MNFGFKKFEKFKIEVGKRFGIGMGKYSHEYILQVVINDGIARTRSDMSSTSLRRVCFRRKRMRGLLHHIGHFRRLNFIFQMLSFFSKTGERSD